MSKVVKSVKSGLKKVGKVFSKVGKEFKRFIKSDLGKAVMVAATIYIGGAAFGAWDSAFASVNGAWATEASTAEALSYYATEEAATAGVANTVAGGEVAKVAAQEGSKALAQEAATTGTQEVAQATTQEAAKQAPTNIIGTAANANTPMSQVPANQIVNQPPAPFGVKVQNALSSVGKHVGANAGLYGIAATGAQAALAGAPEEDPSIAAAEARRKEEEAARNRRVASFSGVSMTGDRPRRRPRHIDSILSRYV